MDSALEADVISGINHAVAHHAPTPMLFRICVTALTLSRMQSASVFASRSLNLANLSSCHRRSSRRTLLLICKSQSQTYALDWTILIFNVGQANQVFARSISDWASAQAAGWVQGLGK